MHRCHPLSQDTWPAARDVQGGDGAGAEDARSGPCHLLPESVFRPLVTHTCRLLCRSLNDVRGPNAMLVPLPLDFKIANATIWLLLVVF